MANWDVTTAAASLQFSTDINLWNNCYQIDSNHFINFWADSGNDGFVQVFTVNTSTWQITTAAASLEFDTVLYQTSSCYQIDSNHFINFWSGASADGFAQVFTVNTTTWAVTTAAARLEFDTSAGIYNSCFAIDSNHFINFWGRNSVTNDGWVQVFTVNTTTWAVTTAAARLEFDTDTTASWNSCFAIDSNHFINFWLGGAATTDGFAQVFTVNTTTWAITTAAARLLFDTDVGTDNSCYQIDENHFINFWRGASADGFAQVFTVNTTTWAITTAAAQLEFDTQDNAYNSCFAIDENHFINFWKGVSADGYVQTFSVDTSTWAITTAAAQLEFDTQDNAYNSCFAIDSNHFINFWRGGAPTTDGFVQVFTVELPTGTAVKDTIDSTGIIPFAR